MMQEPTSDDLSIEGMSSPIAAQILDFCDDVATTSAAATATDLFSSSSPTSNNLCCYADDEDPTAFSPFPSLDAATLSALLDAPPPLPPDSNLISYTTNTTNAPTGKPTTFPAGNAASNAAMFQLPSTYVGGEHHHQQDPFGHISLTDTIANSYSQYSPAMAAPSSQQAAAAALQAVYEEECYAAAMQQPMGMTGLEGTGAAVQGYIDNSGMGPGVYHGHHQGGGMVCGGGGNAGELQGFYNAVMMVMGPENGLMGMPTDASTEYQRMKNGGMGLYGQEPMQRVYSSSDLQVQVMGGSGQHLMDGCSSGSPSQMPSSEITSMEDPTFKVGRLSVEERKEKIHRYKKKRNERNFSKKIKYACRKTLADSRPRVRGRFAKNDEFGEATRPSSSNHDFDDDEEVVVKEEEDILDSSDILAHISGVNSFKFNYALESWI